MLVYSLYGAVAGAIFRIITELGVFVVQGWTGDMAAGVEWSGPTGIMTAWRRSLVTIRTTGLATLKVGEMTQMLVSGGGNVGSGGRPARCSRRRWRAWPLAKNSSNPSTACRFPDAHLVLVRQLL